MPTGRISQEGPRGPYRQEMLYALRISQDSDGGLDRLRPGDARSAGTPVQDRPVSDGDRCGPRTVLRSERIATRLNRGRRLGVPCCVPPHSVERLPELVGNAPLMLEVSRRIRLVAPRSTPVLIEGPTGSGKELVAEALHRLSHAKPQAICRHQLRGDSRSAA